MKKALLALLMAFVFSASAGTALANDVIIANGCDFPLTFIGLSQGSDKQAANLLSEPINPGDGIKVSLNVATGIDLTIQDNEGTQVDFSGLDLSSASKVTVHADGTVDIE